MSYFLVLYKFYVLRDKSLVLPLGSFVSGRPKPNAILFNFCCCTRTKALALCLVKPERARRECIELLVNSLARVLFNFRCSAATKALALGLVKHKRA